METETKRMRELLLTARAILASRPLAYKTHGVCGVLHEAQVRHGPAYTTAYRRIGLHVQHVLRGGMWLWDWLLRYEHIDGRAYNFLRGSMMSDIEGAEARQLCKRLRATRLAWIDSMINNLDTKGTL